MSHEARNWARDLNLSGPRGKHAVLKELADHANEYWATWPSRHTLARETKLNPATVSNYLRDLVKDGLIVPVPWRNEEGGDAGNGYFLAGCPDAPNFASIEEAFKGRRYGFPRGYTPSWWSGYKQDEQVPTQDPLWGEGHTDMRGASYPYEGEGHTGMRGRVTPVLPLEPSTDPSGDPSIKNSATAAPASAYAEAGTSRSDVWADADGAGRAAADAAPAAEVASVIQISTQRQVRSARAATKARNPNAAERRDADRQDQIEAMPGSRVEAVLNKYARSCRKGYEWASGMACGELPSAAKPEYGSDGYDQFLRRVYWWALKFHNKRQNWPAALTWAFDNELVAEFEAKVAARRERVQLLSCKSGAEDKALESMYEAVNAMTGEARAAMAQDIELRKPRIWAQSRTNAEEQLLEEGEAVTPDKLVALAMKYVLLHYRDSASKRWPSFVVPPSMRPAAKAA